MNAADIWRVRAELLAMSPGERNEVLTDELGKVWRECRDARRLTEPMRAVLPRFGDQAAAELLFWLALWLEQRDAWWMLL